MSQVSISKGYDADYCLSAAGTGYYCGGKEPPGVWIGEGARALGLTGQVDPDEMRALYHEDVRPGGEPLDTGQRKAQYDMRTLAKRVEEAIAMRVAELGDLAEPEDVRKIQFEERQRMRKLVPFFDLTHSAEKSVSMAFAGYLAASRQAEQDGDQEAADRLARQARGIERAVMTGASEAFKHAENKAAYVRTGHHSASSGQFRDADGLVGTQFLQHTSRDDEPQLHVHQPILNRAQRGDKQDERWRALHGTMLYKERLAMGARATLRQAQELAQMGFALVKRADGLGYEIAGVTQETQDAFSSRRVMIKKELAKRVADFTREYGHPPNQAQMHAIRQGIAYDTRPAKRKVSQSEDDEAQALLAEWEHKAMERNVQSLGLLPQAIEQAAAGRQPGSLPTDDERETMIRAAVAEVQLHNASWTTAQLEHEMRIQMPVLPAHGVDWVDYMEGLVSQAFSGTVADLDILPIAPVPDVVDVSPLGLRKDGTSIYRPPGEARFVTSEHLDMEKWLVDSAGARMPRMMTEDDANLALRIYERESGRTLDPYQRRAVIGMLTSDRAMDVLVAPAGTGKSWTMAALGDAVIRVTGCRVIGLTTSENAARVLAGHGMTETWNIAKFFARKIPLHRGDVVIVDESSQVSTIDLARIRVKAAEAGAYVKSIGDTEQLPSVDAGGMFRLIAHDHGYFKLPEVRRMRAGWERDSSLRLHDGDITVLPEYRMRGRIHDGDEDVMRDEAVTRWLADFTAGKETLLLAASNEEAALLARLARERMIERRILAGSDDITLADGNAAGVGDLVRARLNTQIPAGNGQTLANRDTVRITGWQGTGVNRKAVAERRIEHGTWSKPFLISAKYLTENAELDYAGNVHVSQGRDVDTVHGIAREGMLAALFYVMATRGRDENHVYTVTGAADREGPSRAEREHDERRRVTAAAEALKTGGIEAAIAAALPPEEDSAKGRAAWEAVLAGIMRNRDVAGTAIEAMREAQAFSTNTRHLLDIAEGFWWRECAPKVDAAITARLAPAEARRYMADPERPMLLNEIRGREIAGQPVEQQVDAITSRDFTGARSIAATLHGRLGKAEAPERGATGTWSERAPAQAETEAIPEARRSMDARQAELGRQQAEKPQEWALDAWGVPPSAESAALRADWEKRAGLVASYREAAGIADPKQALGPMPATAEVREAWFASVRALEIESDEALAAAMTRGELEARRAEYERERTFAPADVSRELDAVSRVEQVTRTQAAQARTAGNLLAEASALALAGELAATRDTLNVKQAARNEWAEAHAEQKEAARMAQAELTRRGLEERIPVTDAERAEAAAGPRETPAMDPQAWAELKAAQTAWLEAQRQAEAERMADQIPVTDAEIARARAKDAARAQAEELAAIEAGTAKAERSAAALEALDAERAARIEQAGVNEPVPHAEPEMAANGPDHSWEPPAAGVTREPEPAAQADADMEMEL